jgi:hypothetical protein
MERIITATLMAGGTIAGICLAAGQGAQAMVPMLLALCGTFVLRTTRL